MIRDLAEGRSRFCELERSLSGISPRTLSLRLRALEEQGIVERHTFPEVPPRVEYSLTPKGEALVPLIEDMRRYGREYLVHGLLLVTCNLQVTLSSPRRLQPTSFRCIGIGHGASRNAAVRP